ncbi:hypothetical protein HJFPF1_13029 [Paramyrothecium foliicola]|nr:hypothetical protein HJFPF1_13029 [Paramyrothecium foliicola]
MALSLSDLLVQYPILTALAEFLSTLDLFHLGLVSRTHHALILSPVEVFNTLKRGCLCDGLGIRRRVEKYCRGHFWYVWGNGRKIHEDEEIEVHLFAQKCDEAGALPCLCCGINICEQCRDRPRTIANHGPQRRPHLNPPIQSENVMCLCQSCDIKMDEQLRGKFLNETCDCDVYKRWICRKCVVAEDNETSLYYKKHTISETHDWERYVDMLGKTKCMQDHQFDLLFFCTCGSVVPKDTIPRCTWCKRKHRPEEQWYDEQQEMRRNIPDYVNNDGCYPIWTREYERGVSWTGYPQLGYSGPIYDGPIGDEDSVIRQIPRRSQNRRQGPVTLRDWQMGLSHA